MKRETSIKIGDLFEIDVTHERFQHLGRKWLVSAIVVNAHATTTFDEWHQMPTDINGPLTSSFLVALKGVAECLQNLATKSKPYSVYRVFDFALQRSESVNFIGMRPLSKREERIGALIAK